MTYLKTAELREIKTGKETTNIINTCALYLMILNFKYYRLRDWGCNRSNFGTENGSIKYIHILKFKWKILF